MPREQSLKLLISEIEKIYPLSKSMSNALEEHVQERTIPRRATLLYEGGSQNSLWFIIRGFAREYQNSGVDWSESTNWFWQALDFVFHEAYFSEARSDVSIDFYTDALILEIDFLGLLKIPAIENEAAEFRNALIVRFESDRRNYLHDLANLPKMDHVRKFYYAHKYLFNFVRHRDLASFLRIKDKSIYRYLKKL